MKNAARTQLDRPTLFKEWLADAKSEVIGFIATLRQLIVRPGSLSLKYFHGEREEHVRPLRLYFSLSAVLFTAASLISVDPRFGLLAFAKYHPNIFAFAAILSCPFLAGAFHLLHLRSRRSFVEHLVTSAHYLSFYFLAGTATIVIGSAAGVLGLDSLVVPVWYAFGLGSALYLTVMTRVVYRQKWYIAALKGMGLMIAQFWILVLLTNLSSRLFAVSTG